MIGVPLVVRVTDRKVGIFLALRHRTDVTMGMFMIHMGREGMGVSHLTFTSATVAPHLQLSSVVLVIKVDSMSESLMEVTTLGILWAGDLY